MYVFLQYFDTAGWVFWPVKTVAHITYTVLEETLNPAQSINSPVSLHCSIFLTKLQTYQTLMYFETGKGYYALATLLIDEGTERRRWL